MLEANLYNIGGEQIGKVPLLAEIFGLKINSYLLHEAVVRYLANQRKGTASTKNRGEVSGGGRKPWRQKGTGRARAGSIRSPLWRHGGVAFGPRPRSYYIAWPKQKVRQAFLQALSAKAQGGEIRVLEKIEINEPKTKELAGIFSKFKLPENSLVVINQREGSPLGEAEGKLLRAARNLPWVKVCTCAQLNVYNVLDSQELIFTPQSLEALEKKNVRSV